MRRVSGTRRLVLARDMAATQTRLGRIERQSRLIRCFSPSAVPGELQTEPYVRAVFQDSLRSNLDAVEAAIRQRLLNQRILDDETVDRRFVFLIPEGALGWAILPAAQMADQVEHIEDASRRRNARVGIIPWGRHVTALPLHSWHLFDTRLVVAGAASFAADLDDPVDVAAYVELTDQIERHAVWDDEARAILRTVAS
jgi:hypothetical protein